MPAENGKHRSLWLQEALAGEDPLPPLEGAQRADVAIVGGGLVGLWTAIRIKEREPSCDVVVLEQDVCGGGASGRNGGEVLSWWAKAGTLVKLCGREEAIRVARASEAAVGELGVFCDVNGIDAQFRQGGYLWTATTPTQLGAWDETVDLVESLGAPVFERLTPEEVARRTGSDVHLAGVLDPSAATVHPGFLVRGLRRVALARGVRIHEGTRVTDLDRRSPAVLRAPSGVVTADRVVLATNAWAASLRELHTRLAVISSDIVMTAPIPQRLAEIGWTGGESISDSQLMIHYYRTTASGRVMFGKGGWGIALGGRVPASFDRHDARAADVADDFRRIYPMLADVPIDASWSGPIDRSLHGIPLFGRLGGREHIVYGVGWSGNGVGPSLVGGKILAALALGSDDEWTRSPLVGERPGRFPPDPVRYVGAHLVRDAVVRMERAQVRGEEPRRLDVALAGLAPAGIVPRKRS
jgi:putative aminophosphonate oxidoreductase